MSNVGVLSFLACNRPPSRDRPPSTSSAEPPEDLLSLVARRVFSFQATMSRVNSEGMVSGLDARSSFQTLSHDVLDSGSTRSLPRIRTRPSTAQGSVD